MLEDIHMLPLAQSKWGESVVQHMHPCHPWVCTSLEFHWIVHGERIPENLAAPVDAMTHIIFLLPSLSQWTSTFILPRISKDWSHHQSLRMLTLFPLYCKHFTLYLQSMGTFFWDYLVNSYSGIRITEHTEYQFPKEQTLCYSENRIADVTNIDVMRPEKSGYAIFPPKDGRKMPQEQDYWLFCLFQTIHYSVNSAELIEYYSVYSGIRIGPKRTQLLQFCVFSFRNSPKRMCPM